MRILPQTQILQGLDAYHVRVERESSSSRAINYNAYHQIGGVGRGGFGARQFVLP